MNSTTNEPTEEQKSLAAALGRIPSGLFIVSFRQGKEETAMLASWVQQCSFEPPLVSIAINNKRWMIDWLRPDLPLGISILGEGQKEMLSHFGKGFEPGQRAFEGIEIDHHPGCGSTLKSAHATLNCRVVSQHEAGDHVIVIARVVGGKLQHEGRPGVHVRRSGAHY